MFISSGRDFWVWLSSQPTLESLTGATLIQKLWSSGLDPRMQHSWKAKGARGDVGILYPCLGVSAECCCVTVNHQLRVQCLKGERAAGDHRVRRRVSLETNPRIKLISDTRGPMCLPHQARNRVERVNEIRGIKGARRVGDPPVMTLPTSPPAPCQFSYTAKGESGLLIKFLVFL